MSSNIPTFPGSDIERRFWGKSELARRLGISTYTLYRYRRMCLAELQALPLYRTHANIMSPAEVEILLKKLGLIE